MYRICEMFQNTPKCNKKRRNLSKCAKCTNPLARDCVKCTQNEIKCEDTKLHNIIKTCKKLSQSVRNERKHVKNEPEYIDTFHNVPLYVEM